MSFKIKISKPGYNVLTETDPNNLVFSSDYNTFKYYAEGTVQFNLVSTGSGFYEHTDVLAHNLGYIPFFFAEGHVLSSATAETVLPIGNHFSDDMEVFADATNLYFYAGFGISGATTIQFTFYYKIFKNNLGF